MRRRCRDYTPSAIAFRPGKELATAAHGVEPRIILRQTRHVGVSVRRAIRDGELFVGNATGRVGL